MSLRLATGGERAHCLARVIRIRSKVPPVAARPDYSRPPAPFAQPAASRPRALGRGRPAHACRSSLWQGPQRAPVPGTTKAPPGDAARQRTSYQRALSAAENRIMAENGALPLGRYTVLDLTRARAGPTCVRQLVDWGARAIKIEMPGGRTGDGMGG